MKERAAANAKARKLKKDKGAELPSQEEAEAATRGFNEQAAKDAENSPAQKRTWASYLPSVGYTSKKADAKASETSEGDKDTEESMQR